MDSSEFNKSKREFIVDEEKYSQRQLSQAMAILIPLCKVTKDGQVFLLREVSTRKRLKLILSAVFVANAVVKGIRSELTREELKAYSGMKDNVFAVRYSELTKEIFVETREGNVRARNILLVEQFLEGMKNG